MVGRPSTALAELVKNSYDADATLVEIAIDQSDKGRIVVRDDGQGMTLDEFEKLWMRVGSQHKREEKRSRRLRRPFTGSKGVGRIAAQMLSKELRLISVSRDDPGQRLLAHLKWPVAIKTGDLVDVTVRVDVEQLVHPQDHGTVLVLEDLLHDWSPGAVRALAGEIWQLEPPFGRLPEQDRGSDRGFRVEVTGADKDLEVAFREQMAGVLGLWQAKAVGEIVEGDVSISLQFRGEEPMTYEAPPQASGIRDARFELRFYELAGRQPQGIKVGEAREYLKKFGGVHIYDTGFRLPFYGEKDNDWLLISYDMSRRVTLSDLLPKEVQERRMMLSLPQWNQVLGAVEISTATEPELDVTITRDRLVDSEAFGHLRDTVRRVTHWYTNEKAKRRLAEEVRLRPPQIAVPTQDFRKVLSEAREYLPEPMAQMLEDSFDEAVTASRTELEVVERRASALGAFATAGIAAVGYQHELTKQLTLLEHLADGLPQLAGSDKKLVAALQSAREEIRGLAGRVREIGAIFAHLIDSENVQDVDGYLASPTIDSIVRQVAPIQPGVRFDIGGEQPEALVIGRGGGVSALGVATVVDAACAVQDARAIRVEPPRSDCCGDARLFAKGSQPDATGGQRSSRRRPRHDDFSRCRDDSSFSVKGSCPLRTSDSSRGRRGSWQVAFGVRLARAGDTDRRPTSDRPLPQPASGRTRTGTPRFANPARPQRRAAD